MEMKGLKFEDKKNVNGQAAGREHPERGGESRGAGRERSERCGGNGRAFWEQGMDEKRFALRMAKRAWIILAAAVAGALFAGGLYLAVRLLTQGPTQYQAQVLYAIRYNVQEEDEVLKEFINEYNAYTWGDMMRSDKVMESVMQQLPDLDRAAVEASVTTSIASDPEFLEAQFTTADPALSDRIAAAFNVAMEQFGQTLTERGLTAIEPWKTVAAAEVIPENKVKNALALGLVLGALCGAVGLALWYVLDDCLVLEREVEEICACGLGAGASAAALGVPRFWGYRTRSGSTAWDKELAVNLHYEAQKGAYREIDLHSALLADTDYELLREAPVVLYIRWGKVSGRLLAHGLEQLARQDVPVAGVVLADADAQFLNLYYGKKKAGLPVEEEGGGSL